MDPNCANKRCLGLKGRGDPPPMWLQTTTERDVRVVVDKELIAGEIEVGDAITIKKGRARRVEGELWIWMDKGPSLLNVYRLGYRQEEGFVVEVPEGYVKGNDEECKMMEHLMQWSSRLNCMNTVAVQKLEGFVRGQYGSVLAQVVDVCTTPSGGVYMTIWDGTRRDCEDPPDDREMHNYIRHYSMRSRGLSVSVAMEGQFKEEAKCWHWRKQFQPGSIVLIRGLQFDESDGPLCRFVLHDGLMENRGLFDVESPSLFYRMEMFLKRRGEHQDKASMKQHSRHGK